MPSLKFKDVYLKDFFTIVGPKEKHSKLKKYNLVIDDYYFKTNTFEMAEIKMQKTIIDNLLKNNKIDYIIGGDLINQIAVSSYASRNINIPFIGVYSACSSFTEALLIASNLVESDNAQDIMCITSSHNLTAEKQYRYPTEYGNTKPHTATSTATGAVGAIVSKEKSKIKIKSGTFGKIIDLGVNDVNHMGAVMAPACADTIYNHLKNNNKKISDYDLILTGDLGKIGVNILKEYYNNAFNETLSNVVDSGSEMYKQNQDIYSGGSGPCCLPLYFFCNILPKRKYHNILLVGTGSLHTPVLVNQHQTIPAISHVIEIEVIP